MSFVLTVLFSKGLNKAALLLCSSLSLICMHSIACAFGYGLSQLASPDTTKYASTAMFFLQSGYHIIKWIKLKTKGVKGKSKSLYHLLDEF